MKTQKSQLMVIIMKISLVDLKAQYRAIGAELDAKYREIMESAAFIKGDDLKEFEKELAGNIPFPIQ